MKWALALCVVALPASAFKIGTAFTPACHERITFKALEGLTLSVAELSAGRLEERWTNPELPREVQLSLYFTALAGQPVADPETELGEMKRGRALNSFMVGVRAPDVEGVALLELSDLRELHLSTVGQEAHFLRAQEDDFVEGSTLAAGAARREILALLDASKRAFDQPTSLEVEAWLEDYGRVRVPVIAPAYWLGRALHAAQDGFTHTYRSKDLKRIAVVQTYVEAFRRDYDEARDGPRHSDALDDCRSEAVAPVEAAATQASLELVRATQKYWRTGDRAAVEAVLEHWYSHASGCDVDDGYCASPWLSTGRTGETSGCASVPGALWWLAGAWWLSRRQKRFAS